ncbi:hypothetical protein CARUB_v10025016mg [Capsella rubella]|uniref:Encoded peptide n=1 Tax=Capsella rubella TaxID=81985 RepID=R0HGH1_9BRAS|nr:precursor of CEP3 [Capsella rubella]EOA28784.1 hypothetical protein CARUB_v10025016mg [Capsella rubella]
MARINVYLFAFILLLTIIINIGSIEGRTLTKTKSTIINTAGELGDVLSPPAESSLESPPAESPPSHGVDNFRPTVPGHSPGIGHSVHN